MWHPLHQHHNPPDTLVSCSMLIASIRVSNRFALSQKTGIRSACSLDLLYIIDELVVTSGLPPTHCLRIWRDTPEYFA
jgi:hypothetical protein